ncbi:MAG: TonB-dependent receptor [Lentisphaeraceae bacterium]|nr:TonB-dependent receptor [Lentisphaeraceae bacterium]
MNTKLVLIISILVGCCSLHAEESGDDLSLSLDKLFSLKVTSVSGTAMDMKKSPAAIYVITSEDFKKQGHTTIAEALRNVPGFYVSQVDSNKWSISSRGFAGRFSNKLLVLVDGRSVYNPLFSGVYWEMQDMILDDINRIEVIRGPGATLWGANAVNGVINIVTKGARETQGGHVKLATGTLEDLISQFRWGDQISDDVFYRIWGKYSARGASYNSAEQQEVDQWDLASWGGRVDWYATDKDTISIISNFAKSNDVGDRTIQAGQTTYTPFGPPIPQAAPGVYSSTSVGGDTEFDYRNITMRWERVLSSNSGFAVQAYYDFTRTNSLSLGEDRETLDLDFRHWMDLNADNSFIYGFGVRTTKDEIESTFITEVGPDNRRASTFSVFFQNTTRLTDDLSFMYGSKIEHNDYTGVEIQPSVRLTYDFSENTTWWASISRAVRTPSRVDDDFTQRIPAVSNVIGITNEGDRNGDSEELLAYELGVRTNLHEKVSMDLAMFYNDYSHLSEMVSYSTQTSVGPGFFGQGTFSSRKSDMHGEAYGVEASLKFDLTDSWQVTTNYTFYKMALHGRKEGAETETPENLVSIQSDYKLTDRLSWHALGYYADNQSGSNYEIDSYFRVDSGFVYRHSDNLEFSAWGRNLLDPYHSETQNILTTSAHQIPRSFYVEMVYKF